MTKNWDDIKWIFRPNGSLRDIYIQDVTLLDWERLIDLLNSTYDLKFGEDAERVINKDQVIEYLKDETGEVEGKSLKIYSRGFTIHCHFFLAEQIEFDVDPKEIESMQDFEELEKFMTSISRALSHQVTLTEENMPELPLIKIDVEKGVYKILSQDELNKILNRQKSTFYSLIGLFTVFKMRFFPSLFRNKLLKSANELHRPTGKNKNIW